MIGLAVVRFRKSARAEEVFQDVLGGSRYNASVAYVIHDAVAIEAKSDLPTYRITAGEPYEIGLVSVPADPIVGVGHRLDSGSPSPIQIKEQRTMNDQFQAERQRTNDILTMGDDSPS